MDTLLKDLSPVLQLMAVMALFACMPFMFVCMTSFMRFAIVFSFLKQAIGAQQVPPPIIMVGLSIILTFYAMGPVFQQMYEVGSKPYNETGSIVLAIKESSKPLKEFMLKQTRENDLQFFITLNRKEAPKTIEDVTIFEVAPAYIMSELKTSFEIGFIIYVPFIVLDIIVANVLLALGMMMLSPIIISLPFKLLLFIAVDGWGLIVNGLVRSFN